LPNSLNPSPALKKSAKTQTQLRFLGSMLPGELLRRGLDLC
jgi:hypothetical protein